MTRIITYLEAEDHEMAQNWYKKYELGDALTLFRACLPDEVRGHRSEHGYVYPEYGGIFTTASFQESRDWLTPWFDDEIEGRKIHVLDFVPKKPLFLHKDRHMVVRALMEQDDSYTEEEIQNQFDVLGQGVIAETSYLAFQYLWQVWGYDCVILTDEGGELSKTEPWVLIMDIWRTVVLGVVEDATPRDNEEQLDWSREMDQQEEVVTNYVDQKDQIFILGGPEVEERDHIIHVEMWAGMLFGDCLEVKFTGSGSSRESVVVSIARQVMETIYEDVTWYNGEGADKEAAESYLEIYSALQELVEKADVDKIIEVLEDYYEHTILYTYKIVTPVMTMWGSDMAPIKYEEGTTVEVVVHPSNVKNAVEIKSMLEKMDQKEANNG